MATSQEQQGGKGSSCWLVNCDHMQLDLIIFWSWLLTSACSGWKNELVLDKSYDFRNWYLAAEDDLGYTSICLEFGLHSGWFLCVYEVELVKDLKNRGRLKWKFRIS